MQLLWLVGARWIKHWPDPILWFMHWPDRVVANHQAVCTSQLGWLKSAVFFVRRRFFGTCLYNFGKLMIHYMSGMKGLWKVIGLERRIQTNTLPVCCCCLCLPKLHFSPSVLSSLYYYYYYGCDIITRSPYYRRSASMSLSHRCVTKWADKLKFYPAVWPLARHSE